MAQMAQQPILNMEIIGSYVGNQNLVGVGEVRIFLIEVGTPRGLMATRFYHGGECRDWRSTKEINDSVGNSCFILDG
jgi:hypothetical protein